MCELVDMAGMNLPKFLGEKKEEPVPPQPAPEPAPKQEPEQK